MMIYIIHQKVYTNTVKARWLLLLAYSSSIARLWFVVELMLPMTWNDPRARMPAMVDGLDNDARWLGRFHAGEREVLSACYRDYVQIALRATRGLLRDAD